MTTIEPDIPSARPDAVERASAALTAFGGQTLNRHQAALLLRHWVDYDRLTVGDVEDILTRFPNDPAEFMRPRSWENPAYGSWMGVER